MTWEGTGGAQPSDVDPFEILAPLAAAATVRIHPPPAGYDGGEPSSRPWGSGFFVAPGWVLTCAHVALRGGPSEGGRREVGLSFGDLGDPARRVRGVVEWADPDHSPADGRWPAPDLALIRLLEPVRHECVWLTERTASVFTDGRVAFFGCTEEDGRIERVNGWCSILGEFGTEGELKLGNQDEIPSGASGGPMVDLERGEVIGIVKARRTAGRDGGLGLSVLQLRRLPAPAGRLLAERDDTYHRVLHAHDRYHADQHRDTSTPHDTWTDAQAELPALARRSLRPGQRAELLGLLAELPPPADTPRLSRLITELRGRPFRGPLPAPRGWRDGLGLLYDPGAGRSELETVLRYAVYAATADHPFPAPPAAEERLLDWAHQTAADLGLPQWIRTRLKEEQQARLRARWQPQGPLVAGGLPAGTRDWSDPAPGSVIHSPPVVAVPDATPPPVTPLPAVLLEVTPHAWEPSRYDWLVYAPLPTGELTAIDADTGAEGYDQPSSRLRGALAEAFRRCDEHDRPVMVQAVLPYRLLDLPIDEWHVSGPPGSRLGDQRPVVVRCADHDPHPDSGTAEAWHALRQFRWEKAHLGPVEPLVLDCLGGYPRALPDHGALARSEPGTVPVLCRGAAGEDPNAMSTVLDGGFDMVLWRREPAAREPNCADFHRGVTHTVTVAGHGGALPEALWRLRAEVGGGVPEAYWSKGLALLYADPTAEPLPGAEDLLEAP
ncbi:trypsin-like peptidase domain-containing protein [Streptomyces sp. B6B3]|uniref:VMAP-C domain-containing protein n=1 Tax=Streptomyces sp. B6B3 TaxID=3153570 RepID=UPI00325E4935